MLFTIVILSLPSCGSAKDIKRRGNYESNGDYYYSNQKSRDIYHTVQFQANGGEAIESKSIIHGGQISSAPVTERNGYRFEGWFMDPTFTQGTIFPLVIENDTVIYAKWLKLSGTGSFVDSYIDSSAFTNEGNTYSLSPNGFNMERLQELGYRMKITVSYEVSYKKDFDGLDIFYAGAPKYETYIIMDGETVVAKEDQKASKTSAIKTLEYAAKITDIKDKEIKLTFSSDNCQNIIYFENICVRYECF